jgi:2-iminobutanoate/2-iminopropanoate deaminase
MRKSIETDVFSHGMLPIPAASRIGVFVASGNIFGYDFTAGSRPETADQQVKLMFGHLRSVITAAGGSLEDILKLTVHVRSDVVRWIPSGSRHSWIPPRARRGKR